MVPNRCQAAEPGGEKLVRLAKLRGVVLRQSYQRVGKFTLIQHQRYAHAKQFKRANRMLKKLRTISAASFATSAARSRATAGSKRRSRSC
jgi:IS5 family transposase